MTRPLPPALTGTDQRLDAVLDELRGLRADLERAPVGVRQRVDRIIDTATATPDAIPDGEPVELRGVAEQAVVNVIAAKPDAPAKPKSTRKRT